LIDTVWVEGEWHFLLYVPTRVVWYESITYPIYFDSAIITVLGNIQGKDLLVFEINSDSTFKEVIIPDSLYYEEWIYSKMKVRKVRKFRIKKDNNNHFIYHNLSPGFKVARHKSDLNDKAKKAKKEKEKGNKDG